MATSGVRVESEPTGARVVFEDRVLPERTPLVLPAVKPGRYRLVVVKEGYREFRTQIVVPSSGQLVVGPLKLVPMTSTGRPGSETPPPEPPATPEPEPGPSGEAGTQAPDPAPQAVKEAKVAAPVAREPGVATVATAVPAAEAREAARPVERAASVSFVVTPWAEVTCNGRKLGETPFQPVELRVGMYDCKFSNPELKRTLNRRIEVRPIDLNVVTVKFE
ncbi:PEGA domain-containing protein [Corallococcus sp. CA047B]|nr:PEGA domain-containing protein [Corallococcus sp. CA047B]